MPSERFFPPFRAFPGLAATLMACAPVPPATPCHPGPPDPLAVAAAGRMVGAFLDRTEGAGAAQRFAAGFALAEATQCNGVLDLVYLPGPDPAAAAFAPIPQRFRIEPARGTVTWAFAPR